MLIGALLLGHGVPFTGNIGVCEIVVPIHSFLRESSEWCEVLEIFGLEAKKAQEHDVFERLRLLYPFAGDFIDDFRSKDEIRRFVDNPQNVSDWFALVRGAIGHFVDNRGKITTLSQLGSDWFGDSKKLRSGPLRRQLVLLLAIMEEYDPEDETLVLNGASIYDNPYTSCVTFSAPVELCLKNGIVLDYLAKYHEMGMAVQLLLETVMEMECLVWRGKVRKLSLMKDGKPTNACYLSFVADYCFGTAFQTGRFKTQSHIIDDKTFNSDIISQLDGVMEFVKKHLMGELVITGKPQHDIKYDYPVDAIREIVLNMIVHRDYRNTGMVNTIKIFDDRMEFTNAGGLPRGLTVKKILSDAYTSSPRNPKVADLFRDAGLIERYGSGIKRIVNSCKNHGGVEVSFENHDTWFKVVLRKMVQDVPVNVPVNVPERLAEAMIELISANLGINRIGLARILGVNVKTVGRHIAGLADKVEYRGSPKTGGYYVVEGN